MKVLRSLVVLGALTTSSVAAGTDNFYRCVKPDNKPPCTASSEDGKSKCSYACAEWVEFTINTGWYDDAVLGGGADGTAALGKASEALYGVKMKASNSNSKIADIWADPGRFSFKQVGVAEARVGTLVVLPNITGVVTAPADENGAVRVVYSSAKKGGQANELQLKYLTADDAAKFVLPMASSAAINAAKPDPKK